MQNAWEVDHHNQGLIEGAYPMASEVAYLLDGKMVVENQVRAVG
jgi:hypothetical protein